MFPEDMANKRYPPIRQRRDGVYEWLPRHNEVIRLNHTTNPEILMIGNSITHFWGGKPYSNNYGGNTWNKFFGKRRVTNMGFGWDRIENVFWRIFHGELEGCHPKHICLLIGVNNISHNDSEEDVSDGVVALAKLIRERQPQAKLHVIKIYPAKNKEDIINRTNNLIAQKLVCDDHTDLVDLTSFLTLHDGSGRIDESLFREGLHPNEKGYAEIARGLKKYLK
jgi:lysophospholipase L1-like esterase